MLYKGTKICYDKTGLMLAQCYSCATGLARVTLCLNNSWHSIADRLLMSKPETGHRRGQGVLVRGEGEVTQSKMADRSGNLPSPLTSTSRPLLTTNIKAPRHRPLCREFTGDRGNYFHLMTSSCFKSSRDLATRRPPTLWIKALATRTGVKSQCWLNDHECYIPWLKFPFLDVYNDVFVTNIYTFLYWMPHEFV